MSRQDKISFTFNNWIKKVHDHKIFVNGYEAQVIRLKLEENMYGDTTQLDIISHNKIPLILDLPDEIPLDRLRPDVVTEAAKTQNVFLFDILPIRGYAQFDDNVEKEDYLIHKMYVDDRVSGSTPYYLILKVSEVLGSINIKHLTRKMFDCAPYNGTLNQAVQDIIDSYNEGEDNI